MDKRSLRTNDPTEDTIRAYSNMVYRLAFAQTRNKSNAEDIYQEVFLRYIKNDQDFQTEEHRKAWLIRVTINCCKKMWTSSWARKMIFLEEDIADEGVNFDLKEETNLHYGLQKLPAKYRRVIHLFYYEGMSTKEISEILNRKESTIRTQLTRGRTRLREILKEDLDV